ncbi:MAG: DUF177 domain-containing protein [Nitrospinota bacterium]
MIFEVEDIPEGGLNFDILADKGQFGIDQPDCSLTAGIKVKGKLSRIGEDVTFSGDLHAPLQGVCTRCLKQFPFDVKSKVQVHFIPRAKEASPGSEIEITESDIDKEVYEEGRIDVTGPIRDQILLEVPLRNLCQEGCKGICPDCGIDLNLSQCNCQNEGNIDPRLAVLKNFKDRLK